MIRNRTNKIIWIILVVLCLIVSSEVFAGPVSVEQVRQAAGTFLQAEEERQQTRLKTFVETASTSQAAQLTIPPEYTLGQTKEILGDDGKVLAYVTELEPEGFIITSADSDIRPILGYSFEGKFPFEDSKQNVLLHLVQWDVEARLKALGSDVNEAKAVAQSNNGLWEDYALSDEGLLQTLASATEWGPWITTQWSQRSHYNDQCPLLNVGGTTRCRVGCVATSIAQIVNYWAYPSSVSFSVADDSYISRGNAGDIDIDGDSTQRDFPDFGELNAALSTINYSGNNAEEAYLCFAAGIKAHMDYGSQSGTILSSGVYRDGFDYGSAQVKYQSGNLWSSYEDKVIENIKDGWPVQIGIQESGRTGGHSVIVDGYKTTGDLHFWINYGWGGTNDTWYNPPNINNYDLVTQIVFNICPYQGWNQYGADEKNTFRPKYPVPTEEPERKWSRSIPAGFDRYTYNGTLVVGTGGRIYAALSSMDQGQNNHPYVHIINQHGTQVGLPSISDSDYTINSLAQNQHGDIYFGCGYGTYNTHDKTIIYRIASGKTQPVPIFTHTSPDPGWPDQVMKIDQSDNIYFMISPNYSANGTKIYSCDRYGNLRWQRYLGAQNKVYGSFPAIDEGRGQVYVIYKNFDTNQSFLIAINNTDGTIKYTFPFPDTTTGVIFTPPTVGEDGTIYVGQYTKLYAFTPTLTKKWSEKDFYPAYVNEHIVIGDDGTLYSSIGKMVGGVWHPGYIRAINPSDGSVKWEFETAALGEYDHIGDIYAGINGIVLLSYTYDATNEERLVAIRDLGSSAQNLWDIAAGGMIAFGPGNTIYTVPSGSGNVINALSVGERGDPDGLAMDYLNNNPPDIPSNPSPTDEEPNLEPDVLLSWDCSDPENHDIKYSLFVRESGYEDMVPVATDINETSYLLEGLNPGTGYAWKIIATDGQAVSEGPTWVFSTAHLVSGVYRFWSPVIKRHFYTIKEAERDKVLNIYAHVWTYEGIVYYAFAEDSEPALEPVYRFWSPVLVAHFYTISERERDKVIDMYPHVWTYEGIAWYAYE